MAGKVDGDDGAGRVRVHAHQAPVRARAHGGVEEGHVLGPQPIPKGKGEGKGGRHGGEHGDEALGADAPAHDAGGDEGAGGAKVGEGVGGGGGGEQQGQEGQGQQAPQPAPPPGHRWWGVVELQAAERPRPREA